MAQAGGGGSACRERGRMAGSWLGLSDQQQVARGIADRHFHFDQERDASHHEAPGTLAAPAALGRRRKCSTPAPAEKASLLDWSRARSQRASVVEQAMSRTAPERVT